MYPKLTEHCTQPRRTKAAVRMPMVQLVQKKLYDYGPKLMVHKLAELKIECTVVPTVEKNVDQNVEELALAQKIGTPNNL